MGIFTGYYESGIKNTPKCAREFLHTRSLKTSPVTSFRLKKYDPVRYRNSTFQTFESVLHWITMFTYETTSIICTGLPFIPPPEADLAWYIQLV